MSMVRLDSGEFPPLDAIKLGHKSDRKLRSSMNPKMIATDVNINKGGNNDMQGNYHSISQTPSSTSTSSSNSRVDRKPGRCFDQTHSNQTKPNDRSSHDDYGNCDMDTDETSNNNSCDNYQLSSASQGSTDLTQANVKMSKHIESSQDTMDVPQSNNFFFCRVGYQQPEYTENLQTSLDDFKELIDFISAPIQNKKTIQSNSSEQTNIDDYLPDLALHNDSWQTRVNVEIGHEYVDNYHFGSARKFEFQLRHALYLTCPSILVAVPESEGSILSTVSVVNDRLSETSSPARVVFQIPFEKRESYLNSTSWGSQSSPEKMSSQGESDQSMQSEEPKTPFRFNPHDSSRKQEFSPLNMSTSQASSTTNINEKTSHWNQWNKLRNLLNIDNRIGVALTISDKLLDEDSGPVNRWVGEPVRFLIIPVNLFVMTEGKPDSLRLPPRCKRFIQMIVNSNSMKTNLILQTTSNVPSKIRSSQNHCNDYRNHLAYLNMFTDNFKLQNQDPLTEWDDKIQPPLQPLSSNLDSSTYTVFELDPVKYIRYRDAIRLALEKIIIRESSRVDKHELILMVLGAGRGPLVDSMLEAIDSIEFNPHNLTIYALDKNPSSVRSLRYKLHNKWKISDKLKIHVVNADMRAWHPGVKADLIATELLGSLSDNELSPECIDGATRFAHPKTISIPQEYSSYIAPICSHKLRNALNDEKIKTRKLVYDQIYVCKLTNYFCISPPQRLFRFEHSNFDEEYLNGKTNERYIKLSFWSDEDTVCHGFAGYFSAKLFGPVHIATLKGSETEGMFSWFPAFIPLQEPIQMAKSTRLDIHFWRKESATRVWYEWAVTHPVISRIYGQNGNETAMSKFI